jgi:predicted RNA binding protein YcfA (HicA-like mRNA interferase family)
MGECIRRMNVKQVENILKKYGFQPIAQKPPC